MRRKREQSEFKIEDCSGCKVRPADLICSYCAIRMCAKCQNAHEPVIHAREKYIERIAAQIDRKYPSVKFPLDERYSVPMMLSSSFSRQEFYEASAIVSEWRSGEELAQSPKVMVSSGL